VAGANVRLLDENNLVIAQTTTESNGQYTFQGVSAGTTESKWKRQGFQKNVISGLTVAPGENQFNTQLRLGSSTETVEVRADIATVNTETASIAGTRKLSSVANRAHVGVGSGSGVGMGDATGQ